MASSPVARRTAVLTEAELRPAAPATAPSTVVTSMSIAAPPAQVWETLLFYEQIDRPPPLLLRVLLPVPLQTRARAGAGGDEIRCLYRHGYLVKRVTRFDPGRLYTFDVVEQALRVGGGVRLRGGWHALRELPGGRTEVETGTCYESPWRPRWLFGPLEAALCHRFHRHILCAMARRVPCAGTSPAG